MTVNNGMTEISVDELNRLRQVEVDYKALQEILERARKLAYLAAEEKEEDRVRFKMDANGNLTRV